MSTALDLIKGALRRINSYQSGEPIAPADEQDCLDTLNDMLDSWSLDKTNVFGSVENILHWVGGQAQYQVGNPTCTALGEAPFQGVVTLGSNTIASVTIIPVDLALGATLTSLQNLIPTGQTVTGIGTNSVTFGPGNATGNSQGNDQITYTVPGDFAIPRPLRITGGFTRYSQLDFLFNVYATQQQYTEVLFKAQPAPWPTIAWYNPQMPYGILNVYQTPASGGEVHLFTDTILSELTLYQTFILPQGYTRAIKWALAKEICAEFGFPLSEAIKNNAAEALRVIKALNAQPPAVAKYDRELSRGNRGNAGWILTGGYGGS